MNKRNLSIIVLILIVCGTLFGASTRYLEGEGIQNPPHTKLWLMPTISGSSDTLTSATNTQTLTNKTLTTPIISSISNTGTLTLPTSTDTLVGRATTDTLTNKTLTSPAITGFTTGSIPYIGASGVLAQSNSNFFYNSGNAALLLRSSTQYGRLGQAFEINQSANYGGMALNTWSTTSGHAPLIDINRSKSATIGTYTSVASGDILGLIAFRGADGTQFRDAALIKAAVDGTSGSADMPGSLIFETTPDNSTSTAARLTIKNDGRVLPHSIHNNSGGCGSSSTTGEICSGTYTATLTNGANVAASSFAAAKYFRVGNLVTVVMRLNVDPTSSASLTEISVSLPVASNFTGTADCIGSGGHAETISARYYIDSDASNDRCVIRFTPSYNSNDAIFPMFSYEVM